MTTYVNPPYDIFQRVHLPRHGETYNLMILRIHQGANSENPRAYDCQHHSLETRHSRIHHKTCTLFTPKSYARTTLQETEETFFNLAVQLKYANVTGNTIIPVYFSELEELGEKIVKTKKQQQTQDVSPLGNQNGIPNFFWGPNSIYQTMSPFQLSPGFLYPYMSPANPFPLTQSRSDYGNFQPLISTSPSPIGNEKMQATEQNSEQDQTPDLKHFNNLEKTVIELTEGQKQLKNKLAGLISYVKNISTKGKKNKKKEIEGNEEEEEKEEKKVPKRRGKKKN